MVSLKDAEAANTALATNGAGRPFVAVFTGGTAGIGSFGAKALAQVHGKAGEKASRGLRVYIVGRRTPEALLAECRALCPFGQFEFVKAEDLSLIKDVDRVCDALIAAEQAASAKDKQSHAPKIDLLIETQGILAFGPRKDTPEGLDGPSSLAYYGRARVADRLAPLLTATVPDGAAGRVALVMNPGLEGAIVESDLGLRDPKNWTLRVRAAHGAVLTTFYMEALAQRYAGKLAAIHYYPGAVVTDLAKNSGLTGLAKIAVMLMGPVFRMIALSHDECGQRVIFLATPGCYPPKDAADAPKPPPGASVAKGADGEVGSGAYRVNYDGEAMKYNAKLAEYRQKGVDEAMYKHTHAAFAAVEAGTTFTE